MQQRHGSGKTAVLVERIIQKIVKEKIDIDKLLVVTFTNAAAAEMRERILDAIYKKLEEEPNDTNMQRQIVLLNKTSICTIHSFCLDVIKNNFYDIDTSPNFRIGDTGEIELLKQQVLDEIFENKYLNSDKQFLKLVEIYTSYRGDEQLKEIILKMYKYIQSSPFPEEWLEKNIEKFNIKDISQDFAKTIWGQILLKNYREDIAEAILSLESVKKDLDQNPELEKFSATIRTDIEKLRILNNSTDSWDNTYEKCHSIAFNKWPIDRKITSNIKDEAKTKRDKIKKKFTLSCNNYMIYNSKEANEDICEMYKILVGLKNIIEEFNTEFAKKKKEKNIIDFNDIEHFALKILVKKDDNGKYVPTEVAKKYQQRYREIAIDEYQDSNLVQEYILSTISNNKNIFMVGDVKQSIYKFRQARPELFLDKYKHYKIKSEKQEEDNLKIQLFRNFRSRKNILDITNVVFQNIMSKQLGDIDYDEEEYLNLGADYKNPENENVENYAGKTEVHVIDLKEPETEEDEMEKQEEHIENTVIEAKFVANKIKEILDSGYQVYDKKVGYRKATYKDIVILLRATSIQAPIYEKEISDLNMPVFSDTSLEYLESVEIQTIMSVLKIIDNPMQDIPLVTTLRSTIGGFTDNDLIQIRLSDKYCNFYEAMQKAIIQVPEKLKNKIKVFLDNIEKWRNMQEYLSLDELIWQIYIDTGYYNYVGLMPNGELRQANLKMLFERAKQYESASFKGLFNFISFIDKLKFNSGDLSSAKIIGENENVIRIMSIHKSKGLEFPIVFLSSCGKKFNMQDLNQNILLHQDIGLGPKYINYERKIEYNTLAKEAIKQMSKIETISEEMRVLYVALTRAKEKLIITGLSKDYNKELNEKEELLKMYKTGDEKINPILVKKYNSYLDWILLVYKNNKENIEDILNINVHLKSDILCNMTQKEDEKENIYDLINKKCNSKNKKLNEIIDWKYANILSTTIPTKTSVTKIKQIKEKDLDQEKEQKDTLKITSKPKFMNNKKELTNAEKGTLMHMCIQRLDCNKDYNITEINNMIEEMKAKEIITEKDAESININKLYNFTKSKTWQDMKKAKLIEKEKPFYINIQANEIYNKDVKDDILVQGIIDLYYIDENEKLVLVDYKTDYVERKNEKSLIDKYELQLEIYKKALEEALNKKVDNIYIYSLYLDKEIEVK